MSGFSVDIMRDLQRVFACLKVAQDGPVKDSEHEYLAKVSACGDFGARVTVPMSAQGAWRHEGCELG